MVPIMRTQVQEIKYYSHRNLCMYNIASFYESAWLYHSHYRKLPAWYLKLGHDRSLPHSFSVLFTNISIIKNCKSTAIDRVVK
jgi:hypothetical protein